LPSIKTVLAAFREVPDSLIAQDTLASQRIALQHQVIALREAVELALLRYNARRASYFEVLETEQHLFPAEDALAQTERDQLLTVVNLYRAPGGRMEFEQLQMDPAALMPASEKTP
jgi:multidrug efflux system outer membrane protein